MRFIPILALTIALSAFAQDKPADTTKPPAAASGAVTAFLVVADQKGDPVTNLTQADFTLKADKKPQTITTFGPAGTQPLTIGLLIDTSRVAPSILDDERTSAAQFLNKLLPAGNTKAFLVQFAAQVQLVDDVTDSGPTLAAGLKTLTPAPPQPLLASVNVPDNSGNGNDNVIHGGTTLYDALFLSADEVTAKYPTRRVLIVISDGIDRGSKETIDSAIEAAQRADTVVYAIYLQGDDRRLANDEANRDTRHTPGSSNNNCPNSNGSGYPRGGGGGYPGSYPGGGLPGGGGYPGSYPSGGGSNPNCTSQHPTGADHKPFVDGHAVLDRISGETGGRILDVSRRDPLEHAFDEIATELHAQYRLTFVPANLDTTRDHYHQIDLSFIGPMAKTKDTYQLRDGFYDGPGNH